MIKKEYYNECYHYTSDCGKKVRFLNNKYAYSEIVSRTDIEKEIEEYGK